MMRVQHHRAGTEALSKAKFIFMFPPKPTGNELVDKANEILAALDEKRPDIAAALRKRETMQAHHETRIEPILEQLTKSLSPERAARVNDVLATRGRDLALLAAAGLALEQLNETCDVILARQRVDRCGRDAREGPRQ